jgi:Family of unknown function (DUF6261)
MNMIQAIDIAKFRNPEYIQFSRNYLSIVLLNNPAALKVQPEYDTFDVVLKDIEGLFKTDQGSNITPVIEALDARRDTAVTGIYKSIDACTNHFDAAKKQAADVLMGQLKVYGTATSVATASLPAETAIITSMVTDFTEKHQFTAAIGLLQLTDWVTELKTANDLLAQKYIERTVELGGSNPNTIKDKRTEANILYYALRDMLAAQATVAKNADPYPKAISELNALIDQYNVLLAGRTGNAAAAKQADTAPAA